MRSIILGLVTLVGLGGNAAAFDCKDPGNPAVAVVCSDPELIKLTQERVKVWKALHDSVGGDERKALVAGERQWLAHYPEACGVKGNDPPPVITDEMRACFKRADRERIAYMRSYGAGGTVPTPAAAAPGAAAAVPAETPPAAAAAAAPPKPTAVAKPAAPPAPAPPAKPAAAGKPPAPLAPVVKPAAAAETPAPPAPAAKPVAAAETPAPPAPAAKPVAADEKSAPPAPPAPAAKPVAAAETAAPPAPHPAAKPAAAPETPHAVAAAAPPPIPAPAAVQQAALPASLAARPVTQAAVSSGSYHVKFTFACQTPQKLVQVLGALERNDIGFALAQTDCLPLPAGREANLLSVTGTVAKIRLCSEDAGCTDVYAEADKVVDPAGRPLGR